MRYDRGLVKATPFYPGQWGVYGSDNPLGLRTIPEGITYYVHSEHLSANDQNPGVHPNFPMETVEACYARMTAGQNDTMVLVGQATAYPLAATLEWNKAYTHLEGVTPPLPGVGQRARIIGPVAVDLTPVINVTGAGCSFVNVQFMQEHNAAEDSGCVNVASGRNHFLNCFIAGMASAVAAARAGSYSLLVTGDENTFERCSIGLATQLRTAANAELRIGGNDCQRNKFIECEFISWSVTAGKFLVEYLLGARPFETQFENCLFSNLPMTGAGVLGALITDAFENLTLFFHQVILRGNSQFVGCTGVGTAAALGVIWSS